MGVVAPLEVSYFSSTPPVTVCGTRPSPRKSKRSQLAGYAASAALISR